MRSWWSKLLGDSSASCWFCQSPRPRVIGNPIWEQLCAGCTEKRKILAYPQCKICGKPNSIDDSFCYDCLRTPEFERVVNMSCVEYNHWARLVVQQWKYRGDERLSRPMGLWMASLIKQHFLHRDRFLITYVPCHRKRVYERGFDQAKQLAHIIGAQLHVPVVDLLVREIYQDQPQSKRSRDQRLQALVGTFSYQGKQLDSIGQSVLLVDDVYTTGSTVRECAKLLRKAHFHPVACTFARANSEYV
ncbi:competence protein ComFC [Croceifilum oryzae]|uniref:Competence protein ComFC n=1 Tax=Croceifilum oryzae TaxID=1553429 RepID=A0AAJ1WNV3_9BACL|nr:phosphoribosyltransferase family protein [Croceifilum oryzae]MDQ0415902.1 competence protein ComFC [Croceifilum oryzae]